MDDNRREYLEGEIRGLKNALNESDYEVIKTLEGLANCTSATGIVTFLKAIGDSIKADIEKRVEWRARINEIEAELAGDTPAATMSEEPVEAEPIQEEPAPAEADSIQEEPVSAE